ncbi:hypothetical protein MMC13_008107 [Lambiella insularis]|nr:hypothetical protein [Lambiella insularis]
MGPIGDLSPKDSVILGVFVGLVSTSVQSLGLTLQRKSHILEDEKDLQDTRRPPYRRRRWQLGMLMFIVSNLVGSTIQITTLPLPVLSTLQASGLVFNSICATLILGEPFTRYSFIGTLLVCGGAVLIAIFGAIGEPAHNLDQLLELLGRRQFVLWMIGQAILVVAVLAGVRGLKYLNPRNGSSPRMRLYRGMAYGCISGILSAHSLLVAKSAVELLVRTIVDRKNQFNRWQSWVILLGLLSLALSQLYYLHRGLKLCSTSILYPFVFCVYNIIAILDGLIYFHQTSRLSLLSSLLIALGTAILLTGVLALSWRLNNDHTSQTPAPLTPLTPGMGFIQPDHSPPSSPLTRTPPPDEESLLLPKRLRARSQPAILHSNPPSHLTFLPNRARTSFSSGTHRALRFSSTPHPPLTHSSDLLSARAPRPTMAEVDEIWGELEEDALTPLASPFGPRRSSARSTPLGDRPSSARAASAELLPPDERVGLLARAGTGRSYRDRRRRRSMPVVGRGDEGRRGSAPQEALGGWWKMRWWRARGGGADRAGTGAGGAGDEA